ncbi:PE-PPE domain-containing protein [Candidatus Mycosynbacter amalyticus]
MFRVFVRAIALVTLALGLVLGGSSIAQAAPVEFDSSSIYAYGGTGNPSAAGMKDSAAGRVAQGVSPDVPVSEMYAVNEFRFDTGLFDKTYSDSRNETAASMVQTVEAAPTLAKKTLVVYSQTGDAARIAARALVAKGFPADQLLIVAQGDPGRQGSTKGIAQVLRAFKIPVLGVDFDEDQSTSGVKVVSICKVGVNADPICDMPSDLDPIKGANRLAGFFTAHGSYGPDLNMSNATISVYGNEIDVDVPTDTPSLVLLARGAGIGVPQELSDALSDYLLTDHSFPKLEEIFHGDFLPELAEGLLQPKKPAPLPVPQVPTSPEEIPAVVGDFAGQTTVYVAENAGAAIGSAAGGAVGSNFGPAGTTLGTQLGERVGQAVGREVGEAAAPVVADIAAGVVESVQTGNPQPAVDAINRALPAGVPPIHLP